MDAFGLVLVFSGRTRVSVGLSIVCANGMKDSLNPKASENAV